MMKQRHVCFSQFAASRRSFIKVGDSHLVGTTFHVSHTHDRLPHLARNLVFSIIEILSPTRNESLVSSPGTGRTTPKENWRRTVQAGFRSGGLD